MEPDIKLLINGEEVEINNELMKMINEYRQRNPFTRVEYGEKYFFIDGKDDIVEFAETNHHRDREQ